MKRTSHVRPGRGAVVLWSRHYQGISDGSVPLISLFTASISSPRRYGNISPALHCMYNAAFRSRLSVEQVYIADRKSFTRVGGEAFSDNISRNVSARYGDKDRDGGRGKKYDGHKYACLCRDVGSALHTHSFLAFRIIVLKKSPSRRGRPFLRVRVYLT